MRSSSGSADVRQVNIGAFDTAVWAAGTNSRSVIEFEVVSYPSTAFLPEGQGICVAGEGRVPGCASRQLYGTIMAYAGVGVPG